MNIFNMHAVTCSQCGLDAQWEQWIDIPQVHLSEEIIKCEHCGHNELVAKGGQAYERYMDKSKAKARGEDREKPEGLIDRADNHGGVQSTATSATDPNSGEASEVMTLLDSVPDLD